MSLHWRRRLPLGHKQEEDVKKVKKVRVRAEESAQLEERGIKGHALEALLGEEAFERHLTRVDAARRAALDEAIRVYPTLVDYEDALAAYAAGVCVLDAFGVGGRMGVEGLASERVPPFQTLGSGRKQSVDGRAWDAAIKEARESLWPNNGMMSVITLIPVFAPLGQDGRACPDEGWTGVGVLMDADKGLVVALKDLTFQAITAAREGLRASLGRSTWFPQIEGIVFEGTPKEWGHVVNQQQEWLTRQYEAQKKKEEIEV